MENQIEIVENHQEELKKLHLLSKILLLPAFASILIGLLGFLSITLAEGPLDNRGEIASNPSANCPLDMVASTDSAMTDTKKDEFYQMFNKRFQGNLSGPTAIPLMVIGIIIALLSLLISIPLFLVFEPANTLRYLPLLTVPLAIALIFTYLNYSDIIHFYASGHHAMVYSDLRYTPLHFVIFGALVFPLAALFFLELELSQATLSTLILSAILWFSSGFLTDMTSLFAKSHISWSEKSGIHQTIKLADYPLIDRNWKSSEMSALKIVIEDYHFHKYIFSTRSRLYLVDSQKNEYLLGFADRQTDANVSGVQKKICLKLSEFWKKTAFAFNVPYSEEAMK